MLLIYYPGEAWIAAAVLFMLALCGLACIVSTVTGIAIADLYRCGTDIKYKNKSETYSITT
jgi:hypothetical protein